MTNIDTLIANCEWRDVNLYLRKGKYKERYAEWAKSGCYELRNLLAHNGHCPEILINDKAELIRLMVAEKHPKYYHQLVQHPTEQEFIRILSYLLSQVELDKTLFQKFLDIIEKDRTGRRPRQGLLQALKRKSVYQPCDNNIIARTMTPVQLYAIGNEAWIAKLSGNAVYNVVRAEKQLEQSGLSEYAVELFPQVAIDDAQDATMAMLAFIDAKKHGSTYVDP